ncbi:MAG: hypothetical protein ACJ76S_12510 [Solirubrobacteraceae bacterium]
MSSRRRPARGALVTLALAGLAIAGLVVAAAVDRRDLAFTPGVPMLGPVVRLDPGREACQRSLRAKASFRAVELIPGPAPTAGPPLGVTVAASRSGQLLGGGLVRGGYRGGNPLKATVGKVSADRIDVCIDNRGTTPVTLGGGKAESVRGSRLTSGGHQVAGYAVSLRFFRGRPHPVLSQVPLIFRRAALFRPGVVGAWTFWLLAALVAVGVPLLLARAVADAEPR